MEDIKVSARPGTGPVSPRHAFDTDALGVWLARHLGGEVAPLRLSQFTGGQSNPTFLLETAGGEYVLRKKPPGDLLSSAHGIDREFRVMTALADSGVPVPRLRGYCEDPDVIGTPFYLMDYQPGRIFTDPLLPTMTSKERASAYGAMNETLVRLHTFDWRGAGLGDYGKPERFVERQLARWSRQYAESRTDDVPAMVRLRDWLEAHIPNDERAAITHGDYRLGNLIFAADGPRIAAVLDWELSTIGHPLSDLAFNCMTYHLPAGHPISPGFVGADLAVLGIPSEAAYLDAYARRCGIDPRPYWRFYMAFSLFRTAAIQQGVYARARKGSAASRTAELFGESYQIVADAGLRLTEQVHGSANYG
jgi:aminoglycoside phosphotransferase (APT) family kinase protein